MSSITDTSSFSISLTFSLFALCGSLFVSVLVWSGPLSYRENCTCLILSKNKVIYQSLDSFSDLICQDLLTWSYLADNHQEKNRL